MDSKSSGTSVRKKGFSSMFKPVMGLGLVLCTSVACAQLQPLSTEALSAVNGQSGARLDLNMRINWDTATGQYACSGSGADKDKFCRLGVSLNNRVDSSNRKSWLVFKGLHAEAINLQNLRIDGVSGINGTQSGLKLTFTPTDPIELRHVGFNALSMEYDDFASTLSSTVNGRWDEPANPTGDPGYLKYSTYSMTDPSVYDRGRETGFLGMDIHGNLSVTGSMTIYALSCTGSGPRC